jgi:hypothetical protein
LDSTTIALVVCAILILVTRTTWFAGLFMTLGPDDEDEDYEEEEC